MMLGSFASTSGRAFSGRSSSSGQPRAACAAPALRAPRFAAAAAAAAAVRRPRGRVAAAAALAEAPLVPVMAKGELSQYPDAPGVYAVYDGAGQLQYIGLSRKVRAECCSFVVVVASFALLFCVVDL